MLTDLCYFGLMCACLGGFAVVIFWPYVKKIKNRRSG